MKYIKSLDALRAVAVLIVLFDHWGPHFPGSTAALIQKIIMPAGQFGVSVFFVLSGFLITEILLREKINLPHTQRLSAVKNFFARRTLRIFPIYYITLIILYAIDFGSSREYFFYYSTYTSNLLIMQIGWNDFAHTWSLSVEEQFYLLWPWVVLFLPIKILPQIFKACILISVITYYIITAWNGIPILMLNCMGAFALGALYAYHQTIAPIKLNRNIIQLSFLTAIVIYTVNLFYEPIAPPRLIYSIIGLFMLHYFLNGSNKFFLSTIANNRFLINIGKMSYGVYLYHYFIPKLMLPITTSVAANTKIDWLRSLMKNGAVIYMLNLAVLAIVVLVSYRFIEIPILKLKKYFNSQPKTATVLANPTST